MNNFLEKVLKKGPAGRKRQDRKGNRIRQKNMRGDSKVESNDSPEIPDRGETADIPGLPLGVCLPVKHLCVHSKNINTQSKSTSSETTHNLGNQNAIDLKI